LKKAQRRAPWWNKPNKHHGISVGPPAKCSSCLFWLLLFDIPKAVRLGNCGIVELWNCAVYYEETYALPIELMPNPMDISVFRVQ
jgi:hypothetical protein